MSTRGCFKCQWLGHIAADCPKRKVVTLAEWRVMDKQQIEEEMEAESEGILRRLKRKLKEKVRGILRKT